MPMSEAHLTYELLRSVARGELPPRLVIQIGLDHLASLCPHCRREIESWRQERSAAHAADYGRAFELLPAILEQQVPRVERERLAAERDLAELLAMPAAERADRIRRARSRFRGQALAALLLQASSSQARIDARAALHLAELARTVLERSPERTDGFDLEVLAAAYAGNALRLLGDLPAAAESFRQARQLVTHESVTDPEVLARVDDLEASLRKDQRQFRRAEELLARAEVLYRVAGCMAENARVAIKLADVYSHSGAMERAVETLRPVFAALDRERDARLFLSARHNLAMYLTDLGRHLEAARILRAERELYGRFPEPMVQWHLSWLEARIAAGEGDAAAAEALYLAARDGFQAAGKAFYGALVALDLARLYLAAGEAGQVAEVAEQALPVLEARDAERELAMLRRCLHAAQAEDLRSRRPS